MAVGATVRVQAPFVAVVAVPMMLEPTMTETDLLATGHQVAFDVPTVPDSVTEVPDETRVELARSDTVRA